MYDGQHSGSKVVRNELDKIYKMKVQRTNVRLVRNGTVDRKVARIRDSRIRQFETDRGGRLLR